MCEKCNMTSSVDTLRGRKFFVSSDNLKLDIIVQGCSCCDNPMFKFAKHKGKPSKHYTLSEPKDFSEACKAFNRATGLKNTEVQFLDLLLFLNQEYGEVDVREACEIQ